MSKLAVLRLASFVLLLGALGGAPTFAQSVNGAPSAREYRTAQTYDNRARLRELRRERRMARRAERRASRALRRAREREDKQAMREARRERRAARREMRKASRALRNERAALASTSSEPTPVVNVTQAASSVVVVETAEAAFAVVDNLESMENIAETSAMVADVEPEAQADLAADVAEAPIVEGDEAEMAFQATGSEESLAMEEMISVEEYLEILSGAQGSEGVSGSIAKSRTAITVSGLPLLSKRLSPNPIKRNPAVALTFSSAAQSAAGFSSSAQSGTTISGAGTSSEGNFSLQSEWSSDKRTSAASSLALGLDGAAALGATNEDSDLPPAGRVVSRNLDLWFGGSYSYFNSEAAGLKQSGAIGVVQMGADARIHENLLVGVSFSGDLLSSESSDGSSATGLGVMVGPYAVFSIADDAHIEVMASYGHAFNDISSLGAPSSSYESGRLLLTSRLSGAWEHGGWTFRPSGRVTYYEESHDGFAAGDGGMVEAKSTRLGEARIGPEIAYMLALEEMSLRPHMAIEGVWAFEKSELDVNGEETAAGEAVTGSLSLGLTGLIGRTTIRAAGRYDGIGDDSVEGITGEFVVRVPIE